MGASGGCGRQDRGVVLSEGSGRVVEERAWLTEAERADYAAFCQRVLERSGIDLRLYKQPQMHRRLRTMVEQAHLTSFMDYFAHIESDRTAWAAFLDRITINVSELFRNPEMWNDLREHVLPGLLSDGRSLRVWSAGCSYGAEPYSVAMLLDMLAPGGAHWILATDIDRLILRRAREGRFSESDVRNMTPEMRRRYLEPHGEGYQVVSEIRRMVSFRTHNLLADPFEKGFDLICCRNVVIYFAEPAKRALFERLTESLRPGGVLFVGGTERVFNGRELGLKSGPPFFYSKAA